MHKVLEIDLGTHHEKDFAVKRFFTEDDRWILMCFLTECMIYTANGLELAEPGDCFIKAPGFLEYHFTPQTSAQGFVNDWMHIQSNEIFDLLNEIDLPANVLISTHQPLFLRHNMKKIIDERQNRYPLWENSIENLVDALFIKLARAYHTEKSIGPNRHEQKLLELRGIISKNVKKSWTVAEMAANVGLSASRFSVLYKKRFGLSPNDDLIKMRIDQAKLLLLSTDSNLLEIAQLCGFQNEYYFSRVFHKYEKISPGIYRREESAGKNSM